MENSHEFLVIQFLCFSCQFSSLDCPHVCSVLGGCEHKRVAQEGIGNFFMKPVVIKVLLFLEIWLTQEIVHQGERHHLTVLRNAERPGANGVAVFVYPNPEGQRCWFHREQRMVALD
jgi:hypothetical protein